MDLIGKNKIKDIDLNDVVIYPAYVARMYSGYGVYDDGYYHEYADPNGSAWRLPAERVEWAWKKTPNGDPVYVPGVIFNPKILTYSSIEENQKVLLHYL